MHYAIVTDTYPPEVNGVALTVSALERGLRARGHDVDVVRPRQRRGQPPLAHELLVDGARLPLYAGLRYGFPCAGRLARRWRDAPPDAIYVATEGPLGWSALRAARRLGIPATTGFHTRFDRYLRDYGLGLLQPLAFAWMRRFHNRADATLVPTRELRDQLRAARFDTVQVLPRAVDTQRFDPARRSAALRADWGVGDAALAVIHVGRIAAEKNLGLAIRAFRALQRRQPTARFVWVGDGPQRAAIARENPDFVFRGVRRDADLAAHFASADLFLFASESETFGNVTVEAMASGVPTVAFDHGAAREHLLDGVHGALIAAGDGEAFVDAACRLADDPAARRAMGLAAHAAVAGLRPDRVVADFESILDSVANRSTRHARTAAA